MNLILVEGSSNKQKLAPDDRRTVHIRDVLSKSSVSKVYVGQQNGAMGLAEFELLHDGSVELNIDWIDAHSESSISPKLTLLVPFCRPQTCRKILRDAACLGIHKLIFFISENAEPAYADSKLWSGNEWKEQLLLGVEQSFDTTVPEVELSRQSMALILENTGNLSDSTDKIALDNYESIQPLSSAAIQPANDIWLAVGAERGWSNGERELLRANGFILSHLGHRVLRTETAIIAATSVIHSIQGTWKRDTRL